MYRKPLRVCLLGASFRVGNGVAALTAGTIQSILHTNPHAEISLLDYGKEGQQAQLQCHGNTVLVRLLNLRFSRKFYLRNNIARLIATALLLKVIPPSYREKLVRADLLLRRVDESDLVASIAGGDSFSDIYGMQRFLYVTLPQLLAIWMGKRLVLLPQTLGPFRSRVSQIIARYIVRRADMVYSRDNEGLAWAEDSLGVNRAARKLRFCYDVAFGLEATAPHRLEFVGLRDEGAVSSCKVGLNISGLLSMGGYDRQNMFGLRCDYDELVRGIIELLIERKGASVLLIPHVFGSGLECDNPPSERIYLELKKRYEGRLGLVSQEYNQSEIKFVIGRCDFFVGSRMHACIAAVSQCVPTVSIAYSDKFTGVMDTLECGLPVADARNSDMVAILKLVDEAFERRSGIRERLAQKMPLVRDKVLGLFDGAATTGDDPVADGGDLEAARQENVSHEDVAIKHRLTQ